MTQMKIQEEKPFIKLFKTPRGFYLYSVNRNMVINISEEVYRYLDGKSDCDLSADAAQELETLREENYLSSKRMKEILCSSIDSLKDELHSRMMHLCLQVTQACNLTCGYCPYANFTDGMLQRNHTNRYMDFETAKKALDYFLEHSGDMSHVSVSFYGGEPLLAYDLIKQVVEYAKELFVGKELLFNITTNGTLLNDEMIDFFAENEFALLFSIDGPEKIHDLNRKRADGTGSFSAAYGNFIRTYKKYLEKGNVDKISINAVLNPKNDIDEALSLFSDRQFPQDVRVEVSPADTMLLGKSLESDFLFHEKFTYLFFLGQLDRLLLVDGLHYPASVRDAIEQDEPKIEKMKHGQLSLPDAGSMGGPCVPGQRKLFVTVDGDYLPCEKVSELCDGFKIGNIDSGVDPQKAKNVMSVSALTPEQCKNCWASQFCTLCASQCEKNGKLSGEARLCNCAEQKSLAETAIYNYILLRECQTIYQRGE